MRCHDSPNFFLQKFQVNFLQHMMQANLSNLLIRRRIIEMDLFSRYKGLCWRLLTAGPNAEFLPNGFWSQHTDSHSFHDWPSLSEVKFPSFREPDTPMVGLDRQSLPEAAVKGIAYMVVYLLVIAIRVSFRISCFYDVSTILS